MTIKIVTDSSCDLPDQIIDRYGITVIPIYIHIGERSYLDQVELRREEFYRGLPSYKPSPTTASPAPAVFRQAYERLVNEGASHILSIHVAQKLSSLLDAAQSAARDVKSLPVTVFDSRQVSLGTGLMVLQAAQDAAEGVSVRDILDRLEDTVQRTYTFAILDTLEYLRRGGRVNTALASIGSLLRIKPIIKVHNGLVTSKQSRTWEDALKRLVKIIAESGPIEQLALLHSNTFDRIAVLRQRLAHLMPQGHVLEVNVGPVLATHVGPGGVGVTCIRAGR